MSGIVVLDQGSLIADEPDCVDTAHRTSTTASRDAPRNSQIRYECLNLSVSRVPKLGCSTCPIFSPVTPASTRSLFRISFGKDENFWSNVFPSDLTRKFEKDIAKFGRVLKTIKRLEVIFAFIPVHVMLRMFRFSEEFGDRMVYPLVALFFGESRVGECSVGD